MTAIATRHKPRVVHSDAIGSAFDAVAICHVYNATVFHSPDIACGIEGLGVCGDRCWWRRRDRKICRPGIDRQNKGRRGRAARQDKTALQKVHGFPLSAAPVIKGRTYLSFKVYVFAAVRQ